MKHRLELLVDDHTNHRLTTYVQTCGCSKSDVSRAALKLGLKQLSEHVGDTGLSTESWIAALNGKVK